MSIVMPETITYGKVVGRFIQGIDDTLDVDLLPDIVPMVGTVTFMPVTRLMKETAASPPTTFARPVMSALIGATGLLTSPAGGVGIWLITGDYKVSYELDGVTISSHDIVVLPEHTDVMPLDLTLAIPPGGPLMSASQYAELVSRVSVIETAQAAVVAAEAAAAASAASAAATSATLTGAVGAAATAATAAATAAAQASATAAAASEAAAVAASLLVGAPVDTVVEGLVSTPGTATKAALDAAFAGLVKAPTGVPATDYANIQGAHDALPATGGILRLQDGTYALGANALVFTKRVTLMGTGMADPFWRNWGTKITTTSATNDMITLAAHGCKVQDVALDNVAVGVPTAGSGIKVTVGDGTYLVNVSTRRFWIGLNFDDGAETWTRDCYVLSPIKYGIRMAHTDLPDGGDSTVTGCQIIAGDGANADAAIYWVSGGGCRIINNKINSTRNGSGVFVDGIRFNPTPGIGTGDIFVWNNSIENFSNRGVYATSAPNTVVAFWLIQNNEFLPYGAANGANIELDASGGTFFTGIIISGNVFRPGSNPAIVPKVILNNCSGRIAANTGGNPLLSRRINSTVVIESRDHPISTQGGNGGGLHYPTINAWTDVLSVQLQDVAVNDILQMTFVATMYGTAAGDSAYIRFVIGSAVVGRQAIVTFPSAGAWIPVNHTDVFPIENAADIVADVVTVKVQVALGGGTQANIFDTLPYSVPWFQVKNLYIQSL